MAVLSKFTSKQAAIAASGFAAVVYMMYRKKAQAAALRRNQSAPVISALDNSAQKKAERAHVDMDFFRRLWNIFRVILPSAFCPESAYMILVAAALMCRTFADIWMIQNGTAIESAIIGRDMQLFRGHLTKFIYAMPAISVVNNMLKYGLNELKLRFRTRLSRHLYSQYMNGFTFYKMSNLDNRIANADQILTQDVEKFCDSVVELYSNVSKPILDMFLYIHRLTQSIGFQGPAWMLFYLFCSGIVLTRLRRPLGKLTVQEQQLEGEFRHINSRVITNSEEIAFYQGNTRERQTIFRSLDRLVDHLRRLVLFKFSMGFLDNIVAKYIATLVGYLVVSRPFLNLTNPAMAKHSQKDLLEDYYKSGRMLVRLAEAIGRLALAGRELTRLAGFTSRLTSFMQVLNELNQGKYVRTMVTSQSQSVLGPDARLTQNRLIPGSGIIIKKDNIIRFDNVPLVTPNGDLLVASLNFEVRSGMNVLVCGPNGCGKSSLFRTLGELWPIFGGTMTKPDKRKLFYIPQRPYMTLGTLRDQIIYPHTHSDMVAGNITDKQLEEYLELVQLSYILDREGGWDAKQDWMDVLSGGEKQRIAMARLFYHRPQFAILDECTSAVSVDVEGRMYSYCRQVGISLFTVSHRKSLWNHHEFYLKFDGQGHYEFQAIDENTSQFGS